MTIVWEDLTVDEFLYVMEHVKQPLAVVMGQPGARAAAEKKLGEPDTWEIEPRSAEFRGDTGGHNFHGNQHTGSKGGGGYSSMAVLGNVVVPPGGPTTSKEYAAALRQAGYKGPLSYPKGKLKELHDVHVKGKTESVNVGHATKQKQDGTTKQPDMQHKGISYEHLGFSSATSKQGDIQVTTSGKVLYHNSVDFIPAGPGTAAAFATAKPGKYTPIGGTVGATGAKMPNSTGHATLPPGTPITTSVKKLAHESSAEATFHTGKVDHFAANQRVNDSGHAGTYALGSYKGMGSSEINRSMNKGTPTAKAKQMMALYQAHGHPISDKVTVDRGVSGNHANDLASLKPGATIEYKNFISTTYNQANMSAGGTGVDGHHSAAAGFGSGNTDGAVIMRITAAKGTKILPGTESEKEMIFGPGKLLVSHISTGTSATKFGGSKPFTVIHFEYLG